MIKILRLMESDSDQMDKCMEHPYYDWLNDREQIYNLVLFDFKRHQNELKRKINRGDTIYQRDIDELRKKKMSVNIMKVIVDSERKSPNKL